MRHVLITGANGFVGSALCKSLSGEGWRVSALIRRSASCRLLELRAHDPAAVEIIEVDYADNAQLARLCSGVDAVVHCAGRTRAFTESDYRVANVDVTRNLVEAVNAVAPGAMFLYVSSQAAAGPAVQHLPRTEDDAPEPVSQYGRSKLEAENLVRDTARRWTIVRPASVYGPGDSDFLYLFQAVNRRILPVTGRRGRRFSVIHVDDLCRHIALCLDTPAAESQTFFAASEPAPTQTEFLLAVQLAVGKAALQVNIPAKLAMFAAGLSEMIGRARCKVPLLNRERALEFTGGDWTCSAEKSKQLLGFEASRDLRQALKDTAAWYREHDWL